MSRDYISKEVEKIIKDDTLKYPQNMAMACAWILGNFKGLNLKVLEVGHVSSLADFFVVASASNYTQAQAKLDRAQAVFAGFFGGVGIGAAGGTVAGTLNAATGNKIVDQARESLTAGYREEQYNEFLKERYGVEPEAGMGEVATEPKTWIKAQIEAM